MASLDAQQMMDMQSKVDAMEDEAACLIRCQGICEDRVIGLKAVIRSTAGGRVVGIVMQLADNTLTGILRNLP